MEVIAQIVKKVKAGDHKAFRALYEMYVSDLYRFALKYVKSDAIAEEIVQDSFVRIWVGRTRLDESLNFRSYLFTIAYHQILREFRRQLRNPLLKDYFEYAANLSEEHRHGIDFDTYIAAVDKAKNELPPRKREIWLLSKEDGLSSSEIAQKLDISEQVVRNQLSAASKFIREEISKIL